MKKSSRVALRVLLDVKSFWPHLGIFLLLTLASLPLTLLAPVPIKLVVDHVIGHAPAPTLASWFCAHAHISLLLLSCAFALAIAFLQSALTLGLWIYQRYLGEKLVLITRARTLAHAQLLSLSQHQAHGTYDLLYRLQNDISNMQYFVISSVVPFLTTVMTFTTMLIITVRLDSQLALLALGGLPPLWLISRWHAKRSSQLWRSVKESERGTVGVLQETFNCIHIIKAFSGEARQVEKFLLKGNFNLKTYLSAIRSDGGFSVTIAGILSLTTAASIYLGAIHIENGKLTLGNFLILMAYIGQLLKSVENFSKQATSSQNALASAARVYELLDQVPAISQRKPHVLLARAKGRIEFRDVSFAYKSVTYNSDSRQSEQMAIDRVSFEVNVGQTVGITGTSGAGKTTLIGLLTRIHEPTSGAVFLDGVDLRHIAPEHLRRQFSLVPQEPLLFSGTIAENIAYARPGSTAIQIAQAAKEAQAHGFIMQLKDGYQTEVGERGSALSGGERQRISIARAFLADAPILVLDEPLSSLDGTTSRVLSESLRKLRQKRTTFVISHHPSILTDSDLVLKIESGRLARSRSDEVQPIPNC